MGIAARLKGEIFQPNASAVELWHHLTAGRRATLDGSTLDAVQELYKRHSESPKTIADHLEWQHSGLCASDGQPQS